jgi:hypothetical protein
MDQSDINYIIELLTEAVDTKEWDTVDEAISCLKEFLDDGESIGLEEE